MPVTTRRKSALLALIAGVVLPVVGSAAPPSATAASGVTDLPSVRLIGITDHATWVKDPDRGIFGDVTTYVGTRGGTWEVWAKRPDYREPIVVSQIVRDAEGRVLVQQPLPDVPVTDLRVGLPDFSQVTLTNAGGETVIERRLDLCPNNYQLQRINDTGPENPTYPESCWASPFATGVVWGIDKGWATRNSWGVHIRKSLPVGSYQLEVAVSPTYRDQFQVTDEDAVVRMDIDIVRESAARVGSRAMKSATQDVQTSLTRARGVVPGVDARPDLVSLPAWGMTVQNMKRSGDSYLNFGATVWNAGPSPLVVEGFREPGVEVMKAFQYFYRDDEKVGRNFAGRLDYDHDDGHDHWHFRDFASYSLLSADKTHIVQSGKESFCLAPTDMVDLTVPGAALRPWLTGLGTACGETDSLWIREVLQVGWGDTYAQYRPGQSFDITGLPNGKYFVEVRANPDDRLVEVTDANNVAYRKIYLKGKPEQRRVEVPPYQGIDTEIGGGCGPFC